MKPYYQDDAVTIYHGDCREILPQLPKVDLVLTDPPFWGLQGDCKIVQGGVAKHYNQSKTVGDPWNAELDWIDSLKPLCQLGAMIFCSYHNVAEISYGFNDFKRIVLLTWYARNSPPTGDNLPRYTTQFIWCLARNVGLKWDAIDNTMIDIPKLAAGCMATERFVDQSGKALHPTQKPLELMKSLLRVGGNTILDPFMGTGTTLRAAKDLGRTAIGIEIEEKYCEIAATRCSQMVMELTK